MINRLKEYLNFTRIKFREFEESRYRNKIRKQLINSDFTIISNNCWAGRIYEDLGLVYNTPTVGLFFYAPCYIKFIKNLNKSLGSELKFIDESKYEVANKERKENCYPIGLVNDEIEIHFLHYKTKQEVLQKWERRKQRVNYNNLFFSFTDNDLCSQKEINAFNELPYRKVFFSAKDIPGIKSLIWLKQFERRGKVGDLFSFPWSYRKCFNVVKWLNN